MASPARRSRVPHPAPRTAAGAARTRALPDLDRLIHERVRLGIVSALAASDSLTFLELRALLGTSDGNLSVHARRLEEAGFGEIAMVTLLLKETLARVADPALVPAVARPWEVTRGS